MRALLTALIAALALAASASADPISVQPLRDAGYSVGIASDLGGGCTTWAVSGHGVSIYVNDCDPDAGNTIASLTNPQLIFERDWQLNHPDQVQAASAIGNACYSISRTASATDSWRIVGGATDTTVAGDALPGLASSLPNLRGADGNCPSGTTVVVVPGTSTPTTTTNPDGSTTTTPNVTLPGSPSVTAAIQTQAQAIAAAAAAAAAPTPPATTDPTATTVAPVDPANYTIVTAPADVAAETGIVAWVNTPYMGTMITADQLPPTSG